MSWTAEEARKLAQRVLSYSRADECEVTLQLGDSSHTRFAANEVTTSGTSRDLEIRITSRSKGKSGTVQVNDTDSLALESAVRRSEGLMAVAPENPEWVEGLGPQRYPAIEAYHEETARARAEDRRGGVRAALEAARGKKLNGSGFFETETTWSAIANKKGLFGFHRSTEASFSTTMRTEDGTGSGWAGTASPRLADIRATDLVATAAKKALASAGPRDIDPGRYTVILEPQAVADLLGGLGFALSARLADEGRSYFSKPGGGNRIGEKLFAEPVTLRSDPFDPRVPGRPWAGAGFGFGGGGGGGGMFLGLAAFNQGLPAQRVTWIEKGVLKNLSTDRYWARKTGRDPIPYTGSLIMDGEIGTVDDLVAGCGRGLLVTRFWYIRSTNPQTFQLTGLTRDGLWLIEEGKVVAPVNNLRFNDSPVSVFKNVEALGAPVATGRMVLPAIRARDFTFSSKSDAV
jgi:predicted Zn-dependent protease